MAETVHLTVEYDTMAAVAQLRALEAQQVKVMAGQKGVAATATLSASAMRSAGLGAVKMAEALATGNISAVALASSMGRFASVLFGPVGIALALAAAGFQLFTNRQKAAEEQSKKFADQLRDTKRRVDDLLHPGDSDPFAKEIQRITDEIDKLNAALAKGPSLWDKLLAGFAIAASMVFGTPVPNSLLDPQRGTREQRNALKGALGDLTPENAVKAEIERFDKAQMALNRMNIAPGQSGRAALQQEISNLLSLLDRLAALDTDAANESMREFGDLLISDERALAKLNRNLKRMESALFVISDAIEDFVLGAENSFRQLLDNLFRVFYRDFAGHFIEGLVARAAGNAPMVSWGGPTSGGPLVSSQPVGQGPLNMQVTYNVQAMDAQGVAAFFEREGGRIAATVAKQAARSKSIRTAFAR